ncbi:uncharacterized protein [Euphorbia lathyris]|uniref:uncharacterized protein n=1 Tax=Euphorbia lathyris TaxID=212925 RepID=UPI003313FA24
MAVAEARAVWQRTANRCFVQEDAKRAPKLACCQSSSSSSKQVDGGPVNGADMPDDPAVGFMPRHRNPSYSNLPPDTRWWLQLQPSYGYQKGLTKEQLNVLEAEMENLRAEIINSPSIVGGAHNDGIGCTLLAGDKNVRSPVTADHRINTDCMKEDTGVIKQQAEVLYDDTRENLKLMDMEAIECLPWLASEKNVPWWRTTDRDDLASLVAQKSLDYVENCDLPPPQKMHVKRYSGGHPGSFDYDDVFSSIVQHGGSSPERAHRSRMASVEEILQSGSDQPFSSGTTHENTCCIGQVPDGDTSKAQLLEALRHSQTRAREAEKVAKQACEEKEHIVKLFLRQASQLFAYKQWCHLLQLETLYYQVKNGEQPMSNLFPVALPWMPPKGKKFRKNTQKSTRSKRDRPGQPCNDISKYAVAFALGLSLVGAGLLLGWTVGWMLPL